MRSVNPAGGDIRVDVLQAIGDTPLIRLAGASARTGCEILGKAEFMNPGQSIKDRAALYIVRDAERRGLLRPGGRIVEGTAGNTGIGLAMVGAALGYRTTVVIPRTQTQEKKDAIRLMGAELVEVDAAPYANENNYVRYSGRLATSLNETEAAGAVWANQFDNVANRQAHAETTGPEIWAQSGGRIDGFICSVGSGGTLAGVALALRDYKPEVVIGLADPFGAALYNYYTQGELRAEGASISEGIGQGRVTANLEGLIVDCAYRIGDAEMMETIFDLAQHEELADGRLDRRQCGRSGSPGARSRPRPHHRHHSRRPRFALSEQALQSGIPGGEGPADPALASTPMNDLISTDWLAGRLGDPETVVLDASWHMPADGRDARAEFTAEHLPGAAFFDIEAVRDARSVLPHMLAEPADFAVAARRLGVNRNSMVVVYDARGIFSAPRAWWNFRVMGHERVAVLDGGLPKWRAEGRPVETGWRPPPHGDFKARLNPSLVRHLEGVCAALADAGAQVIDARPAARFNGAAPEPRPGLRSGHMPGAVNLPFSTLIGPCGVLLGEEALRETFQRAGVDLNAAITTTCGSGISASVLALALARLGRRDVAIYDGSWAEWGALEDTTVVAET